MGVNCRPARLAKPGVRLQRSATSTAKVVVRRDREQDLDAARRRLLHHFITGAAGDQRGAMLPPLADFRPPAQQFIQGRHAGQRLQTPASSPVNRTHAAAREYSR